ncbi:MAG: threonylcarbamoyl-AMP synthase [Deltaproteobacteria bacterium]|nr:threonylcarbamoyl-AMP synthase [Deltaproteobacteria bacterium]
MIVEIHPENPQPRKIQQAVDVLNKGGVIAYATGSVYGFGADVYNQKAVDKVYRIKQTSPKKHNPFSFLCADLSEISKYAVVSNSVYRMMKRLVPGPYTFILEATRDVPRLCMSKQKTVGIRVPDHPVALAILQELGRPIISTSAKRETDEWPLNDPYDIQETFNEVDMVLDSGLGGVNASTVIAFNSYGEIEVLREGAGPIDDLY